MPKLTFQTFSDNNTKVVSGYVESSKKPKVVTEKVDNVMGSCAGAGSGEFHMYLNARNREKARIEEIENQKSQEEKDRLFKEKIELNRKLDNERLAKNVEKRKRLKAKKLMNRNKSNHSIKNDKVKEDDEEEEEKDDEYHED